MSILNNVMEVKCPKCSNTVVVNEGMTEVFCIHCGTKFNINATLEKTPEQKAEALNYIKNAMEVGEYDAVIDCAREIRRSDSDDYLFAALGLLGTLYKLYAVYVQAAVELYTKTTTKSGLIKMFSGKDAYGDNELHSEFFENIAQCVKGLESSFAKISNSNAISNISLCALKRILSKKDMEKDHATYWTTCAVEHNALNLLQFLNSEDITELYTLYSTYYTKYYALPNQVKVLKEMERLVQEKGGTIPKKQNFLSKLFHK